jgi:hypothetical protein
VVFSLLTNGVGNEEKLILRGEISPKLFPGIQTPHETLARPFFYSLRDGFSCRPACGMVVFPTDSPPFGIGRAANFYLWVLSERFRRARAVSTAALSEVWSGL